jgi:uroporphyrinogen decarboxylase
VVDVRDDIYRDMWGIEWQYMLDAYSVYSSPLSRPKQSPTLTIIPGPIPTIPNWSTGLAERAKWLYENTDYVLVGDSIKGGILTKALQIRGYEQMFADLANNIEFAEALLDKLLEMYKGVLEPFSQTRLGPMCRWSISPTTSAVNHR